MFFFWRVILIILCVYIAIVVGTAMYMRKIRIKREAGGDVLNLVPRNRLILASLIVGGSGGVVGGLWSQFWIAQGIGLPIYILPVGIISGFLSCFFISQWYLKFIEDKSWQWGLIFGPLFAILAGTISGFVTILSPMFEEVGDLNSVLGYFRLGGTFGLALGGGTGFAVGVVSSLIFGATRALRNRMKG